MGIKEKTVTEYVCDGCGTAAHAPSLEGFTIKGYGAQCTLYAQVPCYERMKIENGMYFCSAICFQKKLQETPKVEDKVA